MTRSPSYTDDELIAAVADARSWRGVLRGLGLVATSSGAMRSVGGLRAIRLSAYAEYKVAGTTISPVG